MSTGEFVWHDLVTADPHAATAFYGEVIGWKTEPFAASAEPYQLWLGSQGPLGGVMKLDERSGDAPPHWLGHVEVDDLDAIVQTARAEGGRVQVPPTPIPSVGRFGIIADPQGATVSVFQPDRSEAQHDRMKPGEFRWAELHTSDPKAALAFYGALFGWTVVQELEMGPAGSYWIFGQDDRQLGGVMTKQADMPMPTAWIFYVGVDDLDAAIERATGRGGRILHGPVPLHDGTRIAQLADPQGAVFALHSV